MVLLTSNSDTITNNKPHSTVSKVMYMYIHWHVQVHVHCKNCVWFIEWVSVRYVGGIGKEECSTNQTKFYQKGSKQVNIRCLWGFIFGCGGLSPVISADESLPRKQLL